MQNTPFSSQRLVNHFQTNQKGFTLIEILVVMVIIAILVTLGIGGFSSSQEKGRDARRKGDLRAVAEALEVYYNDKGEYPTSDTGQIEVNGTGGSTLVPWGTQFSDPDAASTVYMVKLPSDPSGSQMYFYESDGVSFQLYARLENNLDRDVPTSSGAPQVYSTTSCTASGTECNYGISSSDILPSDGHSLQPDS